MMKTEEEKGGFREEDPPNAQQAQRMRWSLLVEIERNPLNTQHAQHGLKPRFDAILALCHSHLGQLCNVHPRHPACAQQSGKNFPIGAKPSGSLSVSCQ